MTAIPTVDPDAITDAIHELISEAAEYAGPTDDDLSNNAGIWKTIEAAEQAILKRPLVVALMDGGLVQGEIVLPGVGIPDFIVLDFDREGDDLDGLQGFLEAITETREKLQARGIDLSDDWMDEVAKISTLAAEFKNDDEDGPPPDLNPEGDPTRNGAFG